ncbi:MAG: DUF2232 domain-containing protein [Actinobacteria bacterium]|nr:DUF2232 domain-containing protein [Actinomycetota bacterium]
MPFDNFEKNDLKKVNLLLMIFITAIAAAVTLFMPFLNFAGLGFLPVPAVLLLSLNRIRDAVICAVAGLLFLFIFNYILAIVILAIVIAVAFNYRHIIRTRRKAVYILGTCFLIFASSAALFLLINSALFQQNYFKEMLTAYNVYVDGLAGDPLLQSYAGLMFTGAGQYQDLIMQTQSFLRFVPKIFPGLLAVFFGLVSLANYYFSYFMLKKYGIFIDELKKFKEWDLHWCWCWGVIAGIAMVVIPSFNSRLDPLIDIAGYNLIIIFGFLYLMLGMAVLWGLLEKFNVRNAIRYIIVIAVFFIFGLIFLPALGLIDIWANFRKLKRSQ